MTEASEPTGVDLARVALRAALEAARQRGTQPGAARKPKRRTRSARRDGRDPLALGEAITAMMAERAWSAPAAGGDVLARWDSILAAAAPELAGHAQAVTFDADIGQLDVAPDAPAYGTKLRWSTPKLIAHANETVGAQAVRTIHVLPPGPAAATGTAAADPAPATSTAAAPEAPVKTREIASPGYRQALAAHQAAKSERQVDPAIAAAVERQNRALRQQREAAFADEPPVVAGPAPLEDVRAERRHSAAAVHAMGRCQLVGLAGWLRCVSRGGAG